MSGEAAFETRELVKRFGETRALDGVDVRVESGTVHGLLGRNGAGKTTLLRILFGLVPQDAGSVFLFDREAAFDDVRARDGVAGFVEEPRFYPYLTARRNLELLGRLDGDVVREGALDALELVGLESRSEERVGNFSTGMRQRLGLASALLRKPRILVVDEPTIGLDPANAGEVRSLLRELPDHGVTVFLSSHNMAEVEQICDSVTVIARGRIVWTGTLEQLRAAAPAPVHRLTTSDDERAVHIGRDLELAVEARDGRLRIRADDAQRDAYVLALGRAGVSVRRLEPDVPPLEDLFAQLTADG